MYTSAMIEIWKKGVCFCKRIFLREANWHPVNKPLNVQTVNTHPNISADNQNTKQPLYFLNVDANGQFFALFAHVTSSVNAGNIKLYGLQPLNNATKNLINYLKKVFPEDCDHKKLLNDILSRKNEHAALVKMRIEEEKQQSPIVALLPLGETGYLTSAMENAAKDGGEVYKAARMDANNLLGTTEGPLYPDAVPIVVIAKQYLAKSGNKLQLTQTVEEWAIDLSECLNSNFSRESCRFGQSWAQIHTKSTIYPESLQFMDWSEYLDHPKETVSPAARLMVEQEISRNLKSSDYEVDDRREIVTE